MGKNRDLFEKIGYTKGASHAKMGTIKDRKGFPRSSVGKESPCNAGDPGLFPGPGKSPGEGNGYLHQYSWASLVAQLVKNLLAMRETWVQSLG